MHRPLRGSRSPLNPPNIDTILILIPAPPESQGTPEPSQDARSLAIAESKGSADARQAAESAQRRIDIAVEATKRLEEVRDKA